MAFKLNFMIYMINIDFLIKYVKFNTKRGCTGFDWNYDLIDPHAVEEHHLKNYKQNNC